MNRTSEPRVAVGPAILFDKAFVAEKADLTQAIAQMKSAIATLAAVGGDQTSKIRDGDNKQFMAKKKGALLAMKAQVQDALKAALALM